MFLGAQESLLKQPSLGDLALPAPDSLNKFVFFKPEGEWLGWGLSRPPIKPAAGLGTSAQLPSSCLPCTLGRLPTTGQGPGGSQLLCPVSSIPCIEFHWQ